MLQDLSERRMDDPRPAEPGGPRAHLAPCPSQRSSAGVAAALLAAM